MQVLIADDNIDSRELLEDILSTLGFEVVTAFDGQDALEKLVAVLPDLCILDLDMPRKTGFQVVEAMKGHPKTASIPVIMLTAQSDVESRVRGLGLGADDYLTKPFNPRELIARVNTRLKAKATTDDLRQQRELIKRTFSRFIAQEVIENLLAHPESIKLGGQVRVVTVMFADLEGFTTVAEREDPVEILHILNQYHSLLMNIVKRNGGVVDKFLGDGMMVLFNAPLDVPQHVLKAVNTALEIRDALQIFHVSLEPKYRLNVNFGIHTGSAVVGNVGTADLMEYTAIGDTINLASRLQGLSHRGTITVSEAVYEEIIEAVEGIPLGLHQIKGRENAVNVFQIIGLKA